MGKLFGLLGYKISHSMSPIMHNDAFKVEQLPHHYQLFDVDPEKLKDAVCGIKALNIAGFNITIPHKVAIMEYLDEIDETAQMIGAVNTVVNDNGKLIGYNTDSDGYLTSLLEVTGDRLKNMDVLVIGAGGASRAIVYSLAKYGVKSLVIANRTIEKAETIAQDCKHFMQIKTSTMKESEANLVNFDLIINTTSIGMSPNIDESPIEINELKENAVVSDIIYNPLKTKLLQDAEAKGATILNGVGMFVGQGALAFEKWTGIKPDRKRMEQIVLQQLGG